MGYGDAMDNEKHIINALPLIAAVLGRKYGVQVEIGGNNAYTDGDTIHLPSLPAYGDPTLLGLASGYIDHESAHIRETDFVLMENVNITPLEKYIWNIIEDYRVEHKLTAVFPGCGHNFKWLIKHLFIDEHQSNQTIASEQQILSWLLLKIRSWDVHELDDQVKLSADQVEVAFPGLLQKMTTIVDTIPTRCNTTQDCLDVARELVVLLKKYCNNMQQQLEEQEQSGNLQPGDENNNNKQTLDNQLIQSFRVLLNAEATDLPRDIFQVVAETLANMRLTNNNERITIAQVANKATWKIHNNQLHVVRCSTTALRSRLQGLLQSKVFKPNRCGHRGKLDTHNLHRLTTNNPKVFRQKEQRQGLNTAVHILLDTSGSMQGNPIELASQACFATAHALSLIPGVSLAVTAFPGEPVDTPSGHSRDTVTPILKFNQKMHRNFAISANGNTPMDSALWWILVQMHLQPQKRKLILLITDGEPDYENTARIAINAIHKQGVELYGIGINNPSIHNLLPRTSVVINSIEQLTNAMFSMLQKALLTSKN